MIYGDGIPEIPPDNRAKCPVCGSRCDTVYLDRDDEVVGCDMCLQRVDAGAWEDDQKEKEADRW